MIHQMFFKFEIGIVFVFFCLSNFFLVFTYIKAIQYLNFIYDEIVKLKRQIFLDRFYNVTKVLNEN